MKSEGRNLLSRYQGAFVIRSMTGYGRKEFEAGGIHITLEIRSVNNRYIDVQVKAPRSFASLEPRIKKAVQERCSRGRFDVFLTRNGERESGGRIFADDLMIGRYLDVLRQIKQQFGLAGEPDLAMVAGFPGMIGVTEEKEDIEVMWLAVSDGLRDAITELDGMRAAEGKTLVRDMARRLGIIEGLMQAVNTLSPASVEQARKRMAETLSRLLAEQPDPVRLAQEIAILAERTDVTEEITRLGSHLEQFRALISNQMSEPVGRKLDFLLQEMGREANTIASKAMNAQIAHHIVDMKSELEKIREQVQNIE